MLARILGGLGRVLVTAGVLILLFAVYQVWGTNIETRQAQQRLDSEFDDLVREREAAGGVVAPATGSTSVPPTGPDATVPPKPVDGIPAPLIGDLVGRISIPSIGLKHFKFVEGTGTEQLKKGAAHYPGTPLPGQEGNSAIAGHRTTYGAPFSNVDKIKPGDEIVVETVQGKFTYRAVSTKIVHPSDVSVLDQGDENVLTLTACHPRYGLSERIIIRAELQGTPASKLAGQDEAQAEATEASGGAAPVTDELDEAEVDRVQLLIWGTAAAVVWLAAWLLARFVLSRRRRVLRWSPYAVGVLPFLVCLYFFYENLAALLPASY